MHISEAEATKLKETATAALDNFGTLDTGSRAGADDIFAGQDISALLRRGLAA